MDEINALWNVVLWGLGICATGFFVLLGIMLKASREVTAPLQQIRDALLGTLSPVRPGLISKFHKLVEDFDRFKQTCNERSVQIASVAAALVERESTSAAGKTDTGPAEEVSPWKTLGKWRVGQ